MNMYLVVIYGSMTEHYSESFVVNADDEERAKDYAKSSSTKFFPEYVYDELIDVFFVAHGNMVVDSIGVGVLKQSSQKA